MNLKDRLRKSAQERVDQVRVASPCHANWDDMEGDEKVRFCGACRLHVYNLSAMDVEEAAERIGEHEGRLCVRFYHREDGTVLTQDCPVGQERKARRRKAAACGVAAGVGLAGLTVMPAATVVQGQLIQPTMGVMVREGDAVPVAPEPEPEWPGYLPGAQTVLVMVAQGDLAGLKQALDRDPSPDAALPDGTTALMIAAGVGNYDVARVLVERGADLGRRDRRGRSALDLARAGGHRRVIRLLTRASAEAR